MSTEGKQKDKKVEILIAEDSPTQAEQLKYLLEKHDFLVFVAKNGDEALAMLRQHRPAIVISDIVMPKMDGYELCRQIKADEKLRNTPVILLTSLTDPRDVMSGLECGADNFVTKPYNEDYLLARIQYLLINYRFEETAQVKIGVEVTFAGRKYFITSDRLQILNLLLSTYETAVQKNRELAKVQAELKVLNEQLEQKVKARTAALMLEIEERKKAEEALRKSEIKYRTLIGRLRDGVYQSDLEGNFITLNKAGARIYGFNSPEEVIGKYKTIDFYYDLSGRAEIVRELSKTGATTGEVQAKRRDGAVIWLQVNNNTTLDENGNIIGYEGTFKDITERKRLEQALRISRERLYNFMNSANESFVLFDSRLNYVDTNKTNLERLGLNREELIGRNIIDIRPGIKESGRYDKYLEVIKTGEPLHEETTITYPKIGAINIELRAFKVGDGLGIITTDTTERKQAEEKIRQAAEEWRATFDSITDFVSIHDKDFRLIRVNKALADALKMNQEELIGKTCYQVIHGTTEPASSCPHQQTLKSKKPATAEFFEPHLGIHLEVVTSPIFNDEGEVVASVHIARDITARKKMEEQLMLTDRLASIGQLASGIAHELNNPLTSVIGFSELLLEKDVTKDVREDLETINREARRTASVVKGLLTFARKQKTEKEPVNINGIIQGVLQLRSYEQRVTNIEVDARFASDLPQVIANSAQLQQVFINLIINAEQAMLAAHNRGKLTIIAESVGDMVRVFFNDDGPGISPENMRKLFTPFFTTKEVGKGTGLGLSICHGIVTEHGGKIYAESKLGNGATFVVELPVSKP